MKRYDKGVLLTLVTIVLLVLMVAELITYVYITISYQAVSASGAVSAGSFNLAGQIGSGAASLLHASLYDSINALAAYEGQSARKASLVNNSAYALQSLILNGTIYGTSENTIMGGTTISSFVNSVVLQAQREGYGLSITNSTVQVYQTGPFVLNVTYSAVAVINSSSGTFSYPISAASGVYLNGSPDIYSFQNGDDYHIRASYNYPVALLIGNVVQPANNAVLTGNIATSGNTVSSSFIYGTVVVENSVNTKCNAVPAALRNANYILATQDDKAFGGTCGFGGVVTNVYNGPYTVPYLVYGSNNVFKNINNGTALLLSGNSLSLLQISNISSAVYSGYYYNSPFAPSYLEWAQGNSSSRSPYGIYSLNLYNRLVPVFSSSGISSIRMVHAVGMGSSHFSMSLWFSPASSTQSGVILQQNSISLRQTGNSLALSTPCGTVDSVTINGIQANAWHDIVVVHNSSLSSPSNTYLYVDGGMVGNGVSCGLNVGNFIIGGGGSTGNEITGAIGNAFDGPLGVAFAPNGQYAYVTNFGYSPGQNVVIVNTATNTVVNSISNTAFYEPTGVAFAPNGQYAYVLQYGSSNILIVSTATNTVVGSINNNVPSDPIGVAFAPSGAFAYVVGATTSNVYVINTATNTVVSSSMTTGSASGPYEFGVAVAPSDAYLYVTNFDVDTVSIISLVTNSLVGTITGAFDQPKGVAISPDGTYAYVTNWDSSNIVVISTATNTVVGSIDTVFDNPGAIAFSPDGSYAYVPNYGTDNVIIIGDGNVVTNIVDNGVSSGSGGGTFLGSVSNLQTYNISLSHYQVAKAYYSGIDGLALLVGNLTGWWPLNGNANDISGSANNGNVILSSSNSAPYTYLYGYTGDPVYDGSLYNASATLEIEGIYNCANYNQCKNLSRQHLYLGNVSLTSRAGIAMNESSSFGLPNSIVH